MKKLVLAVLLIALLAVPCTALDSAEELENALPQEAKGLLREVTPGSVDVQAGVRALANSAKNLLYREIRTSLKSGFLIAAVCLLTSMLRGFAAGNGIQLPHRAAELTAATAILTVTLCQSGTMLACCQNTVADLDRFNKILTGVFAAATAAAGHPTGAVAMSAATLLISTSLFSLTKTVFLPAAVLYLLLVYGGIVGESGAMRQAAQVEKWAIGWLFKLTVTGFFAYLTFTGLVTGSADAAAVKTAQNLSGTVPLVGNVIAGAAETILAGANVLRAGVGLFGALGAVAICLTPMVRGVCHILVFRALSVVASSFAEGGQRDMLEGISNMYRLLIGMLAACCAVQFIAIVVSMTVMRA